MFEVPYQLPDSWTWASLDELLETLESGGRPRGGVKKYSEGIPSIGGEHLDGKGGFRFDNIRFIPKDYYQSMTKGKIKNLDILVVKDGATTGKTSIVPLDFPFKEAAVNEHVFILRTKREVLEPYYLFRFLSSIQGQNQILQRFQGTAQGGINSKFVEGFPIPLAPLSEQRRIVARVEALLAESKTAREALDKVPVLLRRFRQSVVAKAFRGELTQRDHDDKPVDKSLIKTACDHIESDVEKTRFGKIPQDWKWVSIDEILLDKKTGIRTGPFGTLLKKADLKADGVNLIGIQNVGVDQFIWRDMQFISETKAQELSNYQLLPGDIVISRSGTIDRACVIPPELGFSIMSSNLIRISVNTHLCLPQLLSKFINYSSIFQYQIEEKSKGTTRKFLNNKILRSILLPLPPIREQKRIVARIDEFISTVENIEVTAQNVRQKLSMIDQAVLAKAFRGELVPQDPNDEPASVLLERIKSKTKKPTTIQTKLAN